MKKVKTAIVVALVTLPTLALAAPPDYTGMTDQIDWSTTITSVLLIAGGLAGVFVVIKGARLIYSMFR